MTLEFFMPMNPPTATHQEQKTGIRNGKPFRYEPPELKAARAKLMAHLARHKPDVPLEGALWLIAKWCFPLCGTHQNGEYRTSKPDTDNLNKLLKDCMTHCGYWHDDAQVCREFTEKFWAEVPGIYIMLETLP